jgi:hypothetical protein
MAELNSSKVPHNVNRNYLDSLTNNFHIFGLTFVQRLGLCSVKLIKGRSEFSHYSYGRSILGLFGLFCCQQYRWINLLRPSFAEFTIRHPTNAGA